MKSEASAEGAPAGAERPEENAAANAEWRRPRLRVRAIWTTTMLIETAILGAIWAAADIVWISAQPWWPAPPGLAPGVGVCLLALYSVWLAGALLRAWRFRVRPFDVTLEYGVFTRVRRSIPRARIQHVDIRRGVLERRAGLASLALFTAGSEPNVGAIPGLTPEEAEALRALLLPEPVISPGSEASWRPSPSPPPSERAP